MKLNRKQRRAKARALTKMGYLQAPERTIDLTRYAGTYGGYLPTPPSLTPWERLRRKVRGWLGVAEGA